MATPPDWWIKPRRISVVIDNPSWILPFGERLAVEIENGGDKAILCRHHQEIPEGDVAFYLGCIKITPPEILAKNRRNLIVHESDLPKGRGFSPLTWQILEGKNSFGVCLFEAVEEADAGPLIYNRKITFEGHELIDGMRDQLAKITIDLCLRYLREPEPPEEKPQVGEATYYGLRTPKDSRLDPDKTISEQFNLLRVADNERYPAFFEHLGCRYRLRIDKMTDEPKRK